MLKTSDYFPNPAITQPQPEKTLYADFADWLSLTGRRGHGRSARTITAHLQDLRGFCAWFEAHTGQHFAPELVTSTDLRGYYHYSAEVERVQPATWNRRRITLSLFCEWAQKTNQAAYNPFQGVPVMAEVEQSPKWLERNDASKFLRRVEQSVNTAKTEQQRSRAIRNQAMISLMIYAGLRESEVADLTISDLLLTDRKGAVTIHNGKGGKTRRVPLGREARRAVSSWLEIAETESVFNSLTTRQIQRVVRSIGQEVGLSITPHQLRHTMLKRYLDNGGQLTEAAAIAGHSRLETTRRYVAPGWQDLERGVENL